MEREHIIDDVMTYLELSERDKLDKTANPFCQLDLSHFDKAELLAGEQGSEISECYAEDGDWSVLPDVTPSDLNGKYDVSSMIFGQGRDATHDYKLQLARFRSLGPQEYRGRIKRYLPNPSELSVAHIDHSGRFRTMRLILGRAGDSGWMDITDRGYDQHGRTFRNPGTKEDEEQFAVMAQLYLGMAFTRRYFWHALLRFGKSNSIMFATDPYGAQEIFKLRGIPEGKSRRAALRQWITQHWRKKTDGDQTKVREHLRGATDFEWNGLRVQIIPSSFDLDRNEILKQKRLKSA